MSLRIADKGVTFKAPTLTELATGKRTTTDGKTYQAFKRSGPNYDFYIKTINGGTFLEVDAEGKIVSK